MDCKYFLEFQQTFGQLLFGTIMVSLRKKTILQVIALKLIMKKIKKRKHWVHPVNTKRDLDGEHLKIDDMYRNYPEKFFEYTRMSPRLFDLLLEKVSDSLKDCDTNFRKSIPPRIRLYVMLRFLVTGDHIRTIATSFSLGRSTVWKILTKGLPVLWSNLKTDYVKAPDKENWAKISTDFFEKWNYPNCLGAIDGKHVILECPEKSGSLYLNYKGTFNIVLMATCDANYKFTTVDVGAYGKQSDGGVFHNSALGKKLKSGTLDVPRPCPIPNTSTSLPFHFVGDEAFPLTMYMMRPYPGNGINDEKRIFNYRLSRARRCIENAFGIMAARFRVFRKPIGASPKRAEKIVLAAIALHNFIKTEEDSDLAADQLYCPPGFADNQDRNGSWRNEPQPAGLESISNMTVAAHERLSKKMREDLKTYFNGIGKVEWQNEMTGIV